MNTPPELGLLVQREPMMDYMEPELSDSLKKYNAAIANIERLINKRLGFDKKACQEGIKHINTYRQDHYTGMKDWAKRAAKALREDTGDHEGLADEWDDRRGG